MNRPIKFRAWDGIAMRYLDEICLCSVPLSGTVQRKVAPDIVVWEKPETSFMQFTGLLDKNGKEIYEGDILGSYEGGEMGWYQAGKVEWWKDEAKFVLQNTDDTGSDDEHWETPSDWNNYEIIGNIYENPELTTPS